jgi:hypothetical protein
VLQNNILFTLEKTDKKQEKMSIDFILDSKHTPGYSIFISLKSGFESYLTECSDFLKSLELGEFDSNITSYIDKGKKGIPAVVYIPPQSMQKFDNPESAKHYEAFIVLQLFGMLQYIITSIGKTYPTGAPKKQKSLSSICKRISEIIYSKYKTIFPLLSTVFTSENEKVIIKYNIDTVGSQF